MGFLHPKFFWGSGDPCDRSISNPQSRKWPISRSSGQTPAVSRGQPPSFRRVVFVTVWIEQNISAVANPPSMSLNPWNWTGKNLFRESSRKWVRNRQSDTGMIRIGRQLLGTVIQDTAAGTKSRCYQFLQLNKVFLFVVLKDIFAESLLAPPSSRDPMLDAFPFDLGFSVRDLIGGYMWVWIWSSDNQSAWMCNEIGWLFEMHQKSFKLQIDGSQSSEGVRRSCLVFWKVLTPKFIFLFVVLFCFQNSYTNFQPQHHRWVFWSEISKM